MEEFLRWENLVFTLPLIGTLLYLLLIASGLGSSKDLEHDHDFDHDHDLDHNHVDHDHDAEHGGFLSNMLNILGIGRVPLSIVIMSMGFLWGFTGYACNQLSQNVTLSLVIAGIAALFGTSLISFSVGKLIPKTQSFSMTNQQLVGQTGLVLDEVTAISGTVRVKDVHGTLLDLPARVRNGESNIGKGTKIALTQYDNGTNAFFVSRA